MRKLSFLSAIVLMSSNVAFTMPASASPLDIEPKRVHFGTAACHFLDTDDVWRGIIENTLPKLGQCLAVFDAWYHHGMVEIDVSHTGDTVPCNNEVCGDGTPGVTQVPEVTNVFFGR